MPISHQFPPGNLYTVNSDHDYDVLKPKDTFLKNNQQNKSESSDTD